VEGDSRIKYKILDSAQFIPNKDCTYPFRDFIEEQYNKRLQLKKEKNPIERAIKIVLNAMYEKTTQKVNSVMGNLFNPVISSFITGHARAQLYKFMHENNLERDTVAFATDSVATRRKIPGLDSDKLGEMKLDNEGKDVYYLSNEFYRFNGKWKKRGIGYDSVKDIDIEHMDTKIGKDEQLYVVLKTLRNTRIKSGIMYDRLDKIWKLESYEKKIGLNSDRKRFWLSELKSLNEKVMCDSFPIQINLLSDAITL